MHSITPFVPLEEFIFWKNEKMDGTNEGRREQKKGNSEGHAESDYEISETTYLILTFFFFSKFLCLHKYYAGRFPL